VIELESERLTLRRHRLDDFADSAGMWAHPKVTLHIGGQAFNEEECWARLMRYVGQWELLGFGYWVVREKTSGKFVGEVGFADFRRMVEPSLGGAPEIGWALSPWAHGRGFATEAVRAALVWGESHFGPSSRVVCMIDPGNAPSIRVATKVGFREYARTSYKGAPTILYERRGVG